MKFTKHFLAMALSLLLFTNCGGNATSDSAASDPKNKWTDQDKENAINNCKFGYKGKDEAKVKQVCDCYLEKVMKASPNPAEQSKIPLSEATKISVDCRKEAGLEM
ncbi:MAG: hypothetical protein MUE85_17360 [Microscillaceae bacterium]|jgi:hypothetical protein|nr:hypothetical protein [Microscillaceae bacterium]